MTLNAAIILTAEANQAKAELRATAVETGKLKAATAAAGDEARQTAGDFAAEGAALGRLKVQADQTAAAQTKLKTQTGLAAGSVGNLVANFNDIGMMWASGQTPFMTAIQQGTQVTQVIGPLGAAGAAKALGAAFLGMLNPVNLVIMAAIAAGGAMVQWLFSSEEGVKSLGDAVGDLEGSVKALGERGKIDIAGLKEDFGSVTPEVLRLNEQITQLADVGAINGLRAAIASLKNETEGGWLAAFTDDRWTREGQVADLLGTDWRTQLSEQTPAEVGKFIELLDSVEAAKGPTEMLASFDALEEHILNATGGVELMNSKQLGFYQSVVLSEQALRRMVENQQAAAQAAEEARRALDRDNGRMGGPMSFDQVKPEANVSSDLGQAQDLLATLNEQAAAQQLINQYGADSAEVAQFRVAAEREAFAVMVSSLDVAAEMKAELLSAYDAANAIAGVDLGSVIAGWANQASQLAGNLGAAAANAAQTAWNMAQAQVAANAQLDQMAVEFSPGGQAQLKYGSRAPGGTVQQNAIGTRNAPAVVTGHSSGSGSGGGAAAQAEADAVGDLIERLQEEYELLLVVDPVKKEMLRYREQLAEASDAERQKVEELIRAEIALNNARSAGEIFTDTTASFFDQVIAKGQSAIQVVKDLAAELLSSAANSFITGEGAFADIFGIVGGLFAPQARAEGGMIYGAGGPTEDLVPVMASPGEYMVNARATSRYRPLLEIINAGGDVPGFATGGLIGGARGGAPMSGMRGQAPVPLAISVNGARGNAEIEDMVMAGVHAGLQMFEREVLPSRVQFVLENPRENG